MIGCKVVQISGSRASYTQAPRSSSSCSASLSILSTAFLAKHAPALLWLILLLPFAAEARIPRDRSEVRAFRSEHPCPATGRARGACPGYHVDYIIALCAGGVDKRWNMQWITREDHRFKTLVDVRECRRQRRRLAAPG